MKGWHRCAYIDVHSIHTFQNRAPPSGINKFTVTSGAPCSATRFFHPSIVTDTYRSACRPVINFSLVLSYRTFSCFPISSLRDGGFIPTRLSAFVRSSCSILWAGVNVDTNQEDSSLLNASRVFGGTVIAVSALCGRESAGLVISTPDDSAASASETQAFNT
jgi:hypothetical protein